MQTRIRLGLAAGAALGFAGLLAASALGPVSMAGALAATVKDAVGDTVTDAVEEPIKAPGADIVGTSADSRPDGIVLGVRLQQSVDPLKDPNWSISTASIITWDLDVNGDRNRDYEIEYAVDPDTQQLSGSLYRLGNAPRLAKNCDPSAGFSADAGYSVVVDPKCLGNPTAFSYRVKVVYDTDAKNDSAEYATDLSPDEGWGEPVPVSLAAGVTPSTAPPVNTPIAPLEAPSEPDDADTGTSAPQASNPGQSNGSPSSPPASTPVRQVLPQLVGQGSGSASRPASPPGPGARPAEAAPSSGPLASTGVSDRTLRLAAFAVGIALIGIGLRFANRRLAPR